MIVASCRQPLTFAFSIFTSYMVFLAAVSLNRIAAGVVMVCVTN